MADARIGGSHRPLLWGAAVLTLVAVVVAGCGSTRSSSSPPSSSSAPAPSDLIAISQGPAPTSPPATAPAGSTPVTQPSGPVLGLLSASTGQTVKADLADGAEAVSLSPDGSAVYYEADDAHHEPFDIDRVSTKGGPPTNVASGEDPTISPDSRRLAYATGSGTGLAVLDVARHTTRTFNLSGLIGPGASFLTTPGFIAWLSDTEFVAVPPPVGSFSTTPTTRVAPTGTCSGEYDRGKQCAIVIDLTAAHPARVIGLALPRVTAITALGAGPDPGTLLVGTEGSVSRLAVSAEATTVDQADLTLPDRALVEGFSPDGRHVLYLHNHGPVQLWAGNVNPTDVAPGKELIANVDLTSVSW